MSVRRKREARYECIATLTFRDRYIWNKAGKSQAGRRRTIRKWVRWDRWRIGHMYISITIQIVRDVEAREWFPQWLIKSFKRQHTIETSSSLSFYKVSECRFQKLDEPFLVIKYFRCHITLATKSFFQKLCHKSKNVKVLNLLSKANF